MKIGFLRLTGKRYANLCSNWTEREQSRRLLYFRFETIIFWYYITSVLALNQLLTEVHKLRNIFAEKNRQSKFPWRFVDVASQGSGSRQNPAVQNKPIRSVENGWVLCFYFHNYLVTPSFHLSKERWYVEKSFNFASSGNACQLLISQKL